MLASARDDPTTAQLFLDETRISMRLRHGNIVQVYDFGTTEDGEPYLALELIALVDRELVGFRLAELPVAPGHDVARQEGNCGATALGPREGRLDCGGDATGRRTDRYSGGTAGGVE